MIIKIVALTDKLDLQNLSHFLLTFSSSALYQLKWFETMQLNQLLKKENKIEGKYIILKIVSASPKILF